MLRPFSQTPRRLTMTRTYSSTPQEQSPSFRAKRGISLLLFSALVLFAVPSASAQVQTGTPRFGSFSGGPEVINLGNLNSHLCIPVLPKSGRGINFAYDLCYDSSIYSPLTSGSTTTWNPAVNWGWTGTTLTTKGYATYQVRTHSCRFLQETQWITEYYHEYYNWAYVDSFGTSHATSGGTVYDGAADCGPGFTSGTAQ